MNEESLFHEALAHSIPSERSAFLDAECAGQPELRAAVDGLLAAHDQSGDFLLSPAAGSAVCAAEYPGEAISASAPVPETVNLGGSTGENDISVSASRTEEDAPGAPLLAAAVTESDVPHRVGRYAIRGLLGRGGMGAVYLAHDPELDRLVALKIPKLAGPDAEERFLREARAAAALTHPNLCPVFDVGRADGLLYLAMAYVPGPGLTKVLRNDGPLSIARCVAIAAGVARGMAEAHRHGIVHRDLKPANILLDRHGEPVVSDFGLALRAGPPPGSADPAAIQAHEPRLTEAGVLMGTPAYMPPEQARGELDRIGPASDVYALGAILYELLTGRPPFPATPLHEMVRLIETQPAPIPSAARSGVPRGLDAICRRAMAKDPKDRYQTMDEFAAALALLAAQARRRRMWRAAVAGALLIVLIAVAGVVFYVKTDNGTLEIRINDPAAGVKVTVDGQEITLTDGARVTKLRAGPHGLLVEGDGFKTESRDFTVTRGKNPAVVVTLQPIKKQVPVTPDSDPKPPVLDPPADRTKLARLLRRGDGLIRRGQFGELETVVAEALKIDPQSPGALALRATTRAARQDVDGARADVEAALKLNPETLQALLVRVFLSGQDGKLDDSIADATAAIRIDPTCSPAWSNRAMAYLDRGDFHQAIADATRAIELRSKPPDINAYLNRAGARACLGAYDEALDDYKTALELAPNHPRIWLVRSALHIKMANAEKAAADWEKAKSLNPSLRIEDRPLIPDPPKPPKRKKLTDDEKEDLDRALAAFKRAYARGEGAGCEKASAEACRIDPTSAAAHSARARILAQTHRFKEALAEAAETLRHDPNDAWAYSVRAVAKLETDDPAGAVADATVALRLAPLNAVDWNTRGLASWHRGQYRQAIADLSEAIRLRPGYELAYPNRGNCHLRLGEFEAALADYTKAAELQPTVALWRMMCSAIRARLDDPEGSRKEREAALKLDEKQADVVLPPPLPKAKVDPEVRS